MAGSAWHTAGPALGAQRDGRSGTAWAGCAHGGYGCAATPAGGRCACSLPLLTLDSLIGRCGLVHLDNTPEIEVGYLFAADCWGKAYATEAARAALDYGFTELDLDRIVAITRPENLASQRVLEKIGMRFERNARYYDMEVRYFSIPRARYRGKV